MIYFSVILTFILFTLVLNYIAPNLKLIDIPNHRKIHDGNIPLIGGIVIYLNVLFYCFFYNTSFYINILIYTSSLIIFLGVLDDSIELGVIFRLFAQLVCTLIIIGSGLYIENIGSYFVYNDINLGIWSIIFTVFCVIGLTNSFNFIDGIDGLCSVLSIISILSILLFSYILNTITLIIDYDFIIIVSFIIFLFVFFNLNPYFKIFLGDAGSMFLGFFVSWLLILYSQNPINSLPPILTIWCVTIPVFDFLSVTIRRILRLKNPFKPDKTHLHHLLIGLGISNYISLLVITIVAIIANLLGFYIYYFIGSEASLIFFLVFLIIYIIITFKISNHIKVI